MSDIFILEEEKNKSSKSSIPKGGINQNMSLLDKINNYLLAGQGLKVKDKVVFYRLLSTMINAGLTLTKAISILEKQEKKGSVLKFILGDMIIKLKEGKGLSGCMKDYPKSFSPAEIGMIESGEKTGKLNKALIGLADQVEKIASINGKLKSALMYPAMIIIVVIGVVAVMMIMVVPKLLEIFEGDAELPASTRLLIKISDTFVNYWWLMLIIIGVGLLYITIWKKTPVGKYYFDKFMLKLPVFGGITQKIILSKFARVLSGMLTSGVSIVESLRITSDAVGNEVYRQRILLIGDDIKQGLKMYESIDGDPLFPEMLVSMVQIGEQTAKLDEIIIKLADFYDEEVDNTVGTINKLLEPIIIVFMAVVVGFIAIAIMQPIMNLADQVSNS